MVAAVMLLGSAPRYTTLWSEPVPSPMFKYVDPVVPSCAIAYSLFLTLLVLELPSEKLVTYRGILS